MSSVSLSFIQKEGDKQVRKRFNEEISDEKKVEITRPVYKIEEFHRMTAYEPPEDKSFYARICQKCSCKEYLSERVPILNWIPEYYIRYDLPNDIGVAILLAASHIAQGFAYSVVSNIPPIIGLYAAVFPVLVYCLLGTSNHVSVGSFSFISYLVGKIVISYSSDDLFNYKEITTSVMDRNSMSQLNLTKNGEESEDIYDEPKKFISAVDLVVTVTIVVGLMQMAMYALNLGVIRNFISQSFINGLTSGLALHIVVIELKHVLGIPTVITMESFNLIKNIGAITQTIGKTNVSAATISAICIMAVIIFSEIINPLLLRNWSLKVPEEILLITFGALTSYYGHLDINYNLPIVGEIDKGFTSRIPLIPDFSLIKLVAFDCFIIALISYVMTVSIGRYFAVRSDYSIDEDQELFAMAVANILGGFFACAPICASHSRTKLAKICKGRTQIASLISSILIAIAIVWLPNCLKTIPICILASIIVVFQANILRQLRKVVRFWRLSKDDFIIWLVTFTIVVIIDVQIGFICGLLLSSIILIYKSMNAYTCIMGNFPGTDLYANIKRFHRAVEIPGIKMFYYSGGLSFAQCSRYRNELIKRLQINSIEVLFNRKMELERVKQQPDFQMENYEFQDPGTNIPFRCLILEMSSLSYIDPAGVRLLQEISIEYQQLGVLILFSCSIWPIFEKLQEPKTETDANLFTIFPSINEAVIFAKSFLDKKRVKFGNVKPN